MLLHHCPSPALDEIAALSARGAACSLLALTLFASAGFAQQGAPALLTTDAHGSASPALLEAMSAELNRAFASLGRQSPAKPDGDKQLPPYFLSYSVRDQGLSTVYSVANAGGRTDAPAALPH